jgi:hypothetical protein
VHARWRTAQGGSASARMAGAGDGIEVHVRKAATRLREQQW